jgi:serine/threonine protein kinase
MPTPQPMDVSPPVKRSYRFLLPPVEADEIGRLGNFRVLDPLGEGGMAYVFRGEDLSLRRQVALKVLKPNLDAAPEAWERFLREARITASIRHDHLVTVFHAGQEGSTCFFAMELLEGEPLDARMDRAPAPSMREVLRIGREIATGLSVIHAHELIHRDIKPSNLWLEAPDGRVKILDLGLARPVHGETTLTQTGLVVGTPAFMSPEQARGDPLDARTDLFSLGAVLYALCVGAPPFGGETTMAVLTALAVDEPTPPHEQNPEVPPELSRLILRLLAKNRDERPASADELVLRLRQIEAGLPPEADLPDGTPTLADDRTPPRRRKKPRSGTTEAFTRPSKRSKQRKRRAAGARFWVPMIAVAVLLTAALTYAAMKSMPALSRRPPETVDPGLKPRPGSAIHVENVFLNQLTILDNHRFGPSGENPPPHARQLADITPKYRGQHLEHGIFMHPGPGRENHAGMSFDLGKRFRRFHAQTSLNDDVREPVIPPITFRVFCDDEAEPRWTSPRPITSQSDCPTCDISVEGVKRLRIEASCPGEPRGAHALWIDPRLE